MKHNQMFGSDRRSKLLNFIDDGVIIEEKYNQEENYN